MIRSAVGASRARLVRQMLTESLVLACVSGLAGFMLALRGLRLLEPLIPHVAAYRPVVPSPDLRAFGFALGATLFTAVAFGLFPAFRTSHLAPGGASTTMTRRLPSGRPLLVAELALSVLLLTGAGVLLKSFWNLQQLKPGFSTDHILTMQIQLPRSTYGEDAAAQVSGFFDDVVREIERLPGVASASAVNFRPFMDMFYFPPIDIPGRTQQTDEVPIIETRVITPNYYDTLGVSLLQGRALSRTDRSEGAGVTVINETMARRY